MTNIKQVRMNINHIFTGKLFTFSALSNTRRIELARNAFSHLDHTKQDILSFFIADCLEAHLKTVDTAIKNGTINIWCVQLAEVIRDIFVGAQTNTLRADVAAGLKPRSVEELKTFCRENAWSEHTLENILCEGYLKFVLQHLQFDKLIHPSHILHYLSEIDFCRPETFQDLKIKYLLTNLKLNKAKKEDLLFWENQCTLFPGGHGGETITCANDNKTYHIPTTVAEMMNGASQHSTSFTMLTQFINQTRLQQTKSWLTTYIRGDNTARLYDSSTNIENISFASYQKHHTKLRT